MKKITVAVLLSLSMLVFFVPACAAEEIGGQENNIAAGGLCSAVYRKSRSVPEKSQFVVRVGFKGLRFVLHPNNCFGAYCRLSYFI